MIEQKRVRLLIVDDSSFMRIALERMIKEEPGIEVIGSASNGQDAIEKVLRLKPDVVTMDIEMPVMDGLHALKEIMRIAPTPVIMVSSMTQNGAQMTLDAMDLGAIDFVSKPGVQITYGIFDIKKELIRKILAASESEAKIPKAMIGLSSKRTQSFDANLRVDRIIVIGASTGGPPAIRTVLAGLSSNIPVPIVIGQHMPRTFTNAFAQRLNSLCSLRVKEAVNGEVLQRSIVYICPGDSQTGFKRLGQEKFVFEIVSNEIKKEKFAPCIDSLFMSAVEIFGRKTIGLILTGMGEDGIKGLLEIRKAGGLTIAQDKSSSVIYGMPRAAAEKGAAIRILPIGEIAAELELSLA